MIQGLINGIKSMIGAVGDAVSGVAEKIRSYLHFSVPDVGPLTDYESWMPDFMKGLASGINANRSLVANAVRSLASDMNMNINPNVNPTVTQGSLNATASNPNAINSKPAIIQLMLPNSQVLAEFIVDDINKLQGSMQVMKNRVALGRR